MAFGLVAALGISETAWVAALLTLIEIGGLLIVVAVSSPALLDLPERLPELLPPVHLEGWTAILSASVLCFYAFLGFEDMINVAEEVKDVRRTLPLAILWTLFGTLILYILLATTAVLAVPPEELAKTEAPLALLYERATGHVPYLLSVIGALAMSNGLLIQIVKASRVLYGLADQSALPAVLAHVDSRTHTPLLATAIVTGCVLLLGLLFSLQTLAQATSLITLGVFALIAAALLRVQRIAPPPPGVRSVPRWVAVVAAVVSLALLVFELVRLATFD